MHQPVPNTSVVPASAAARSPAAVPVASAATRSPAVSASATAPTASAAAHSPAVSASAAAPTASAAAHSPAVSASAAAPTASAAAHSPAVSASAAARPHAATSSPAATRSPAVPSYTVSIAPMMDCTDRHFRYFARILSPSTLLYTEMISAAAIVHGNPNTLLAFHPCEHPISLQIGGSDCALCARAVEIAEQYGYDEYNLNVGCPSPKVQKGMFGAQLMEAPERVAQIVKAIKRVTQKPVTVKHRLGINPHYCYDDLARFINIVSAAEPARFTVHARIALLDGLSPKQNRTVPPLMYAEVYRLKKDYPHLTIEINGGIQRIDCIKTHLQIVDGVMIGREAYRNPRILQRIEQEIFRTAYPIDDRTIIAKISAYIRECEQLGIVIPLRRMCAHLCGLYHGCAGAKKWRRALHFCSTPNFPSSDHATLLCRLHEAFQQMQN